MLNPQDILKKYWGYDSFRDKQLDVINSVLESKDTLTLLPTGSGKSICYQIPCLMTEGLCIVICPLIALINDQVSNLKEKKIRAMAITSGMSFSEIDIILDNAIYGNYKFLYISPERLESKIVQERIKKMNINLIAVDEAHCISEWGYNFRPSYLKLAQIRELTKAPIIALTASATPIVLRDIQEKLSFSNINVIKSSFYRDELSYVVLKQKNKDKKLIQILKRVKGSTIIYCRTRKETKRINILLKKNRISSHFYHAGLDHLERELKQKQWLLNHVRVMVATNAFGMGINKEDVRLVIHNHLPFSLESYYQETGRAGRDKKLAYTILVYNNIDVKNLKKQIKDRYPDINIIRNLYQNLANFFSIALGEGKYIEFEFYLEDFCKKYKLDQLQSYNVLNLLEKEGYIKINDTTNQPSKIHIKISHTELYKFQIKNKKYDFFIKILLRSYGTLFDDYTVIQESILAKRLQITTKQVKEILLKLENLDILKYIPENNSPKLMLLTERLNPTKIIISKETLELRKSSEEIKVKKVLEYASNQYKCRSIFLQKYFGDNKIIKCNKCDICLERNKYKLNDIEYDEIIHAIKNLIISEPMKVEEIIMSIIDYREDKIVNALQFLIVNGQISINDDEQYSWIS